MTQQLLLIGAFLALLAALPWALRRLRNRMVDGPLPASGQSRFISAVAVGPTQRVVTVEVGPEHERVWLTVGVTAQSVTCLHTAPAPGQAPRP
jgi:flagellar protein FliO/FliZ